ncbi:MAG: TonB-dependent receptor plug domain-containing protein [Saprospiraceae bacterium]
MSKDVFNVPAGRSLLTGILLFLGMIAMAQDRSIEGTVTDKEGMPLIGANILIKGPSGPTASANVTIRCASSLSESNHALFVVNGMPITNRLFSTGDGLNGTTTIDFGNAAQLVNPDDIESISVLKGPGLP